MAERRSTSKAHGVGSVNLYCKDPARIIQCEEVGLYKTAHMYSELISRAPKRYWFKLESVQASRPLTHVPSGCVMTSTSLSRRKVCDPTMIPKENSVSQGILHDWASDPRVDVTGRRYAPGIASSDVGFRV